MTKVKLENLKLIFLIELEEVGKVLNRKRKTMNGFPSKLFIHKKITPNQVEKKILYAVHV